MGSEDIDSGAESVCDEASDSDGPGSDASLEDQDDVDAQAGEEEEDEVGDLSWEAVMAAVQGGGSDEEDGEEEPAAVAAAMQAESETQALTATKSKANKQLPVKARVQGAKAIQQLQQSPLLGKRSRQK